MTAAPSVEYEIDLRHGIAVIYNSQFPDQRIELEPEEAAGTYVLEGSMAVETVRRRLYKAYRDRYMA